MILDFPLAEVRFYHIPGDYVWLYHDPIAKKVDIYQFETEACNRILHVHSLNCDQFDMLKTGLFSDFVPVQMKLFFTVFYPLQLTITQYIMQCI
jgi:hypothetical protein